MPETIVRSADKMVFRVNPETLDPLCVEYYDCFCFDDPLQNVHYIEFSDWVDLRSSLKLEKQVK
jgi:hypothetical protein